MPIYEYRRPDGTTFEVQQSFSDEALTHDPESGAPVTRVLHPPAVHFKGKGFYNTDYGKRSRQREGAGEEAAATSGSGSSDDAKPTGSESASANGAGAKGGAKGKGSGEGGGPSRAAEKKPVAANE